MMDISKLGPPEPRDGGVDCDVYFTLNKAEVNGLSNPITQAAIAAALAPLAPPFGEIAAVMILAYIGVMQNNSGPGGVSVKCTIRQDAMGIRMKEFIAEPI